MRPWKLAHLLIAAIPSLSISQERVLADIAETRRASEAIVASLATGNTRGAVGELKPLSVIPAIELEAFEAQLNIQTGEILRRFGMANGYEFLREERLGSRLVRQQFLVFHEKAPLRWQFVFYRSEKGWQLNDFRFDANTIQFWPAG